ncbi:MAG: DUF4339 domain-containing protein [Anaerorhabdus sp.]
MDKVWYVKSSTKKGGPFNEQELIKIIESGLIDETFQLWTEGLPKWIALKNSVYCFYMLDKELLS